MAQKYPDVDIQSLEVYHNDTNRDLFLNLSQKANITSPGIPELFIGNTVLVGELQIRDQLEQKIQAERAVPTETGTYTTESGTFLMAPKLTVPLIVVAALVDSVNPCAFSVLLFLLISLLAAGNRRRALIAGSVYIAAVFFFYLFSGFGLFSAIHLSGFSSLLSLIGAAVAIILGIVGIADSLKKDSGFLLSIPESQKGIIEHYVHAATLPAAFVLGILVGILELPCTGGIYLAILGLMGREMTLIQGLPYLLLYNFAFVLPLIIVVLIVGFGLSPERAEAWRKEHRRTLRLFIGIVMIALGIAIIWFR